MIVPGRGDQVGGSEVRNSLFRKEVSSASRYLPWKLSQKPGPHQIFDNGTAHLTLSKKWQQQTLRVLGFESLRADRLPLDSEEVGEFRRLRVAIADHQAGTTVL
jgi:hypothetical protein